MVIIMSETKSKLISSYTFISASSSVHPLGGSNTTTHAITDRTHQERVDDARRALPVLCFDPTRSGFNS